MDYIGLERDARFDGYQEGFERGFARGEARIQAEITQNMYQIGISVELIAKYMRLSVEEVIALQRKPIS